MSTDTRDELIAIITKRISEHPRSLQKRIGPSEIGTPCARKLGHKLAGTAERERQDVPWRPTIGTAVHEWLETTVDVHTFDQLRQDPEHQARFLVEKRVMVGQIDGADIEGSCDLFDIATGTVVDYKIVGPTSLKKYRGGPDPTYRIQAHLYGAGWVNAGHDVKHVAIFALPSAGELHQAVYWTEPFDPAIADAAMKRASGIAKAGRIAGWDVVLPTLATADDRCLHCPFRAANTTDLVTGCPGHEQMAIRQDAFTDLVAS